MSLTMKAALTLITSLSLAIPSFAQIAPTEAALRTAIASGGSITFNSSGTISVATPFTVSVDTTIDGTNQNITIDGQALTRLFAVNPGIHFTLKNLVLANGLAKGLNAATISDTGLPGLGGAVKSDGGLVTIANCTFTNNHATGGQGFVPPIQNAPLTVGGDGAGGAIWQSGGTLSIQAGSFIGNNASGGSGIGPEAGLGGAIFASGGSVSIEGTAFLTNSAYGGGTVGIYAGGVGEGGAIYAQDSTIEVRNAHFTKNGAAASGNSVGAGGAVSLEGSSSGAIRDSEFTGNGATGGAGLSYHGAQNVNGYPGYGGAIYVGTNAASILRESALHENNTAGGRNGGQLSVYGSGFGGAIYVDGSLSLINATLVGNAATQGPPTPYQAPASEGGAIFSKGTVGATNITVVSNSATTAAIAAASGSFTIKNSLFGKNFGVTSGSGITDAGNNLSSSDTPAFSAPSSHQVASLKIGPFGDYGGPTPTIPLLAGSPAIDAGDDSAAPLTDQRGRTRPFGAHSDVGAFESSAPFYIFGKLNGYLNSSQTVTLGAETVTPDNTGGFHLFVPQGSSSLTLTGTNTVFSPNPLIIDAQAEMDASANAYQLEALAGDISGDPATFVFAGRASETWEFDVSNDLVNWTPVHTNTFSTEGVYSMPLTNVAFPVFMKGVKK